MKVKSVYFVKKLGTIVDGISSWNDELQHKQGDVLVCGDRSWTVSRVDRIHQSCFGVPKERRHTLILEPIGHSEQPNVGDELVRTAKVNQ